jgi:O-antigen/teichoic acid export membrane protein
MLRAQTILGAGWTVSSRLTGRFIDFITVLVLARLLSPADFGLTALAMTLVVIADTVLEVPLILALTRLKSADKAHLDTAFTLAVLRGLLLALVVFASSWPFAHIYGDERLVALIAFVVIGPVARSLYSPAMVRYIHRMNFTRVFVAEVLGKIIAAALAISTGFMGIGYWAIVTSSVTASVATTAISYVLAPYRPALGLSQIRDFSTFLGWLSPTQIIFALSWQFERLFLGQVVPKSDLGQYTMASDLSVFPTQSLMGPAMQPVIAAFSRINDDRERLRSAYLRASRITMLLVAPTCIGMSLTSDMIIAVLLGPQWSAAEAYFHWLVLWTVLSGFYMPLHSLALSMNRAKAIFRLSIIDLCSRIILLPLGFYLDGLIGVVAARGAVAVIMFASSLVTARLLAGLSISAEAANLWKVIAACGVMALSVLLIRHELVGVETNVIIQLGLTVAIGIVAYFASLFVLGLRADDYFKAR